MKADDSKPVRAPEIAENVGWINSEPLTMAGLRGKAVLIDFWDYTCVNCIRTLPYLREWHKRYAPHGLVIIGVHAPEFPFAREYANVERAAREFDIDYPIVLDNDFATWSAYSNHYWPAKYFVDGNGYVRASHFGEGGYGESERLIQQLLEELHPNESFPDPMEPVRPSDKPGAVCYRVTPELYLGSARGRMGNTGASDGHGVFTSPDKREPHVFYLDGKWTVSDDHSTAESDGARMTVSYAAAGVNCVLHPSRAGSSRVEILLDGKPVPANSRGQDVRELDGRTFIEVAEPRMYYLLDHKETLGVAELTLIPTRGVETYAFTFVSCVAQ